MKKLGNFIFGVELCLSRASLGYRVAVNCLAEIFSRRIWQQSLYLAFMVDNTGRSGPQHSSSK